MKKNYFVLFSFATMLLSVGCYINSIFLVATLLAILSILVLLFANFVYSIKVRKECIIFLFVECVLMFFDRSISFLVHIEFIFFSSLTYSILCAEKRNEMMLSFKVGLLSVFALLFIFIFEGFFIKSCYGLSIGTLVSYCPIMISILMVWLISYTRKLVSKH